MQRRIERAEGRPSCESEAFEAMLDHAIATWEAQDPRGRRTSREHRVFERDGWRCTAPDGLRFELGRRPGAPPLAVYEGREVKRPFHARTSFSASSGSRG